MPFDLPEMVPWHVLDIFVYHVEPDRLRLAIAPYGPRVLVPVVTLGFGGRGHHAAGCRGRHAVLVDASYHDAGYDLTQRVGQQHFQVYPDRALQDTQGGYQCIDPNITRHTDRVYSVHCTRLH